MISTYQVLPSKGGTSVEDLARDVSQGLSRSPKSLPSRYFYDAAGSRLFQRITEQEEYYLTRCEREILKRHGSQILSHVGDAPFNLVELGVGDGHKTEILLQESLRQELEFDYVPIDICRESVAQLTYRLRGRQVDPRVRARGIVADYADALLELGRDASRRKLVLFLGSSIGNFTLHDARHFLRGLRRSLRTGDLALIGFDLKKDLNVLHRAYNDAAGVTRAFNFNLLTRLNRELGADFDLDQFVHYGAYNPRQSCMESWLVSTTAQRVQISALATTFEFAAWEGIRVERSFKYDRSLIHDLARASGFTVRGDYHDRQEYFVDSLWQAIA